MRMQPECYPCMFRQVVDAARAAGADEEACCRLLNRVGGLLPDLPEDCTPPHVAQLIHRMIRETTGNADPYADVKRIYNEKAFELLPLCRDLMATAEEPLQGAVRLAVAGNVIDFGGGWTEFDLEKELRAVFEAPFRVWSFDRFRSDVAGARRILYLADNAGEIVFDRLLVDALRQISGAEITFAVRGNAHSQRRNNGRCPVGRAARDRSAARGQRQ